MYLTPQNVPSAVVLTLGNEVVLYCSYVYLEGSVDSSVDRAPDSCVIKKPRVRVLAGAAGEFSSPGSAFCADLYFGIHSTPRVTAEAHIRSWLFSQKCRWQVTAKHTSTLRMWLLMK